MVKLCEDFAADSNPLLRLIPGFNVVRKIYTIEWAEMLIKAYKTHGAEVEAYEVPIAWTRATYNGGPRGTPSIPGNRPKCKCNCNCKGDIVTWDFVWEPIKPRSGAVKPEVGLIE